MWSIELSFSLSEPGGKVAGTSSSLEVGVLGKLVYRLGKGQLTPSQQMWEVRVTAYDLLV